MSLLYKTGEHQIASICRENMFGYLSADKICSSEFTVSLRASFSENCSLLGTDHVRGQISEHIFGTNGGYSNKQLIATVAQNSPPSPIYAKFFSKAPLLLVSIRNRDLWARPTPEVRDCQIWQNENFAHAQKTGSGQGVWGREFLEAL